MKSKTLEKVKEYKRSLLGNLLFYCTEKEQSFFKKMHGDYKTMPEEGMDHAIIQCENTLKKRGGGLYGHDPEKEKKTFTIEEIQAALINIPLHSVDQPTDFDKIDGFTTSILTFEKNAFLEKLYEEIREKELDIKKQQKGE